MNSAQSVFSVVSIAATVTPLVAANNDRSALVLCAVDADIFVSDKGDVTPTTGMKITSGQPATELCQCHVGTFVKRALFAITGGGAHNITVLEGFEPVENQTR